MKPRGLSEVEVAWGIRALYREDKLGQPRIAQLLGHDKSWVCRKLTLAEGLSDELTASVGPGLISAIAGCRHAAGFLTTCPQSCALGDVLSTARWSA